MINRGCTGGSLERVVGFSPCFFFVDMVVSLNIYVMKHLGLTSTAASTWSHCLSGIGLCNSPLLLPRARNSGL